MHSKIYTKVSQLLAMLPATAREIADALDLTYPHAYVWLRQLRAKGIISTASKKGGKWVGRQYLLQPSNPYKSGSRERTHGIDRFAAAWHALKSRHSCESLADEIEVSRATSTRIIKAMREAGLIRVSGWVSASQCPRPYYDRLGGSNAPRPERQSREEMNEVRQIRRERVRSSASAQSSCGVQA